MAKKFLISKSTANYWAKQAYQLSVHNGIVKLHALAQDANNNKTKIHLVRFSGYYLVSWMQNGKMQHHHCTIRKNWI